MYLLKQAMEYLKLINQAVLIKLVEFSKQKKRETILANINPVTIEKLIQLVNPNINLEELTAIQLDNPLKGQPFGYMTNAKVTKRVLKQKQDNAKAMQTEQLLKEALKLTVSQNQLEEMLLMQEDFDVNDILEYSKEEMEQFIQSQLQYIHKKNQILGLSLDVSDLQAKFNIINKETEGPRETLRKLIVETRKTTQTMESVPLDPNFDLEKILKEKGLTLQNIGEKSQSNAGYIMQSMLKDFTKSRKNYFELQDDLLKFSRFQTIDVQTRRKKQEKPKEVPKSEASTTPDITIFDLETIITQAEKVPELEANLQSLKKINDELSLKYEVSRKKYQELEYSKDRLRLEFDEFSGQYNDLDNQNTVLTERLRILEEKFYKKKNKMRNFKKDIVKVQQTQVAEQTKQKESQLNQNDALETKVVKLEKQNQTLQAQKDSYQQKYEISEKSLSGWIDKYNKLLEELLEYQKQCQNSDSQLERITKLKVENEMKLALQQQSQKKLAQQLEASNQLLEWQQSKQLKSEKDQSNSVGTVDDKQTKVDIQQSPEKNKIVEVKEEVKKQPSPQKKEFDKISPKQKAQKSKQVKQPSPKKVVSPVKKFGQPPAKELISQAIQTEPFSQCDEEIQAQPSEKSSLNQSKMNESQIENQVLVKQINDSSLTKYNENGIQTDQPNLQLSSAVYSMRLVLQKTLEQEQEPGEEIIQQALSFADSECQTEKVQEYWQVFTDIQEKEKKIETKNLGVQVKIANQNKNKRIQTKMTDHLNQYIQTDELFASNLNSILNETTDAPIMFSSPKLLKHENQQQIKEQVKQIRDQSLNKHTKKLLKAINQVNNTYLQNLEFDLNIKQLNAPKRDDITVWKESKQQQKMEILKRKNLSQKKEQMNFMIQNSFEKQSNSYFKEGHSLEELHPETNILTHSLIQNDSYLQQACRSQKNLKATTTTNSMHQALEIKSALMKKAQMLQKPLLITREVKKKYPFKQLQSFQQLQNSLKFLEQKFTSGNNLQPEFMTLFPHQSHKHNSNFHYLLPSLQTPRPNCVSLDESNKPDNQTSLKSFFTSKYRKNDYQSTQFDNQQKEQKLKHYFAHQ